MLLGGRYNQTRFSFSIAVALFFGERGRHSALPVLPCMRQAA